MFTAATARAGHPEPRRRSMSAEASAPSGFLCASARRRRLPCCGDLIGYGPDPNRVVDWVRGNVATVIRGNHDKATLGAEILEWFNPVAKAAAIWTLAVLTPENCRYVQQLPKG